MADHDAGERSSANSFGKDPLSTTTSMLPIEGANSQTSPRPEVRRVSGNFNPHMLKSNGTRIPTARGGLEEGSEAW
jgi:hypothetical protein